MPCDLEGWVCLGSSPASSKGICRVQSSHVAGHVSASFWEANLFVSVGLVPLVRLAERCELATLIRRHVDLGVSTGAIRARKAMSLASWPTPSEYQDWSVEQLPVALGDDGHLAIDDGDGGLIVDGVARQVKPGGPALRVG